MVAVDVTEHPALADGHGHPIEAVVLDGNPVLLLIDAGEEGAGRHPAARLLDTVAVRVVGVALGDAVFGGAGQPVLSIPDVRSDQPATGADQVKDRQSLG